MQSITSQFRAFQLENAQSPQGSALMQLPTSDGSKAASQIILPDVISYRLSRTGDMASDTLQLTFADDLAKKVSTNKNAPMAKVFKPGVIDKKVLFYLGYKGAYGAGTSGFNLYGRSSLLQFTGYLETDANDQTFGVITKTASFNDLMKQFRFQVYDTFPHPLYGNQTLSYFDYYYNLTNPSADGATWVCDGKMFTLNNTAPVWGATHVDPDVYVDTTGGGSPASTPVSKAGWSLNTTTEIGTCTNYTFDYKNGIVTFTSAGLTALGHSGGLPANSIVSVAGNPTHMAPEVMVRKLLVEKASWSPAFLNLQASNILLPMFNGQDQSIWDCLKLIAAMTCPRYTPWTIQTDENGLIHFLEHNIDAPPVKTFRQGHNVIEAQMEYTSRDLRTVVRGDGTVAIAGTGTGAGSDQQITSLAFDLRAVTEYGLTEPLTLTQDATDSVRHLTPTQAVAHLNQIAQAVLYQVSRPVLTIQAKIIPDYALQINDKVRYTDSHSGMDREFLVNAMDKTGDATTHDMTVTLTEYYETINMNLGVPAGVTQSGTATGATVPVPSSALIGAVRLGSGPGSYIYNAGDYARDGSGNPIIANWNPSDGSNMRFDLFLNPGNSSNSSVGNPSGQYYSYTNLPVLSSPWTTETNAQGDTVFYVAHNTSDGYTYYVGPDSVFYKYNHGGGDYHITSADVSSTWIPTGNVASPATGGSVSGGAYSAYVWQWFYLCLDSTRGAGKLGRLLMRINPSQDGSAVSIGASAGTWITNGWSNPPGPYFTAGYTKAYSNLAVGISDYTSTPPGFIGANVMGDGVNIGVAYGADVSSGYTYLNYGKRVKGHYCVFVAASTGASQFMRFPFWLTL